VDPDGLNVESHFLRSCAPAFLAVN
jgi:hypothetical protein